MCSCSMHSHEKKVWRMREWRQEVEGEWGTSQPTIVQSFRGKDTATNHKVLEQSLYGLRRAEGRGGSGVITYSSTRAMLGAVAIVMGVVPVEAVLSKGSTSASVACVVDNPFISST